jgi:thiamine pyrophosphokinase
MRAAILGAGPLHEVSALRARIHRADLVICADGGLRAARRLGLRPHVALGDFDSASRPLLAWARRAGAEIVRHPVAKDKTDAELALGYALARGAREIEFFGALGGRVDHLLANVALLLRAGPARMRIVDGPVELFLARRRTRLGAHPGDLVSLLPLSRTVTGVTTRGLKFPLTGAMLREGSSLGVSNEVVSRAAAVSVRSGDLLIVHTRRRRGRLGAQV